MKGGGPSHRISQNKKTQRVNVSDESEGDGLKSQGGGFILWVGLGSFGGQTYLKSCHHDLELMNIIEQLGEGTKVGGISDIFQQESGNKEGRMKSVE